MEHIFLNDKYKILELINDNSFSNDTETYCPLTQEEMAKQLKCSRVTINSTLKVLQKEGYIIQNTKNRRYSLSTSAQTIVKQIKNINWEGDNGHD